MVLVLLLRWVLARENAIRDTEQRDDSYDDMYVTQNLPDGTMVKSM